MMAAAVSVAATEQKRKSALSSLSCAATKTLLAICCSVPGRVIPTTKICVDDKVRLRDVLAAWAEGVMKVQDGEIPAATRVLGTSSASSLNLDATLRSLRSQLPVRDGRLTVSVLWPPEQKLAPADGAQRSLGQAAGSPKPASGGAADPRAGAQLREQLEKMKERQKDKAREKAKIVKQKAKDKARQERKKEKEKAKKEKKKLKEQAKRAKAKEDAVKAKEEAKKERAEARAKRKAEGKENEAKNSPSKQSKTKGENGEGGGRSSSSSGSSSSSDSASSSESDNECAGSISRFLCESSGSEA
mmetsp:Transcript_83262/g.269357  ORF Transcript_83262/g.269357 Transcript_83262/m.269357 type:complete len:302 (-) Transcript_83262:322-1227(-)